MLVMEDWQRYVIRVNLSELVQNTKVTESLLAILMSEELLSNLDKREIMDAVTGIKQASRLYNILSTRSDSYIKLCRAFLYTGQSGAYKKLLECWWTHGFPKLELASGKKSWRLENVLDAYQISDFASSLQSQADKLFLDRNFTTKLDLGTYIPAHFPTYKNRMLSYPCVVNSEIFEKGASDKFIFKGDKPQNLEPLESSNLQVLELTSKFVWLDNETHWKEMLTICDGPIHLIEYNMHKNLYILRESKGDRKHIEQFLSMETNIDTPKYSVTEECFVTNHFPYSSAFCINARAGGGKSLLLSHLAMEIDSRFPDTVVYFTGFSNLLYSLRGCDLSLKDHVLRQIGKIFTQSNFALEVLLKLIESRKSHLVICLDGYDKVSENDLPFVSTILQCVISLHYKITVLLTTRNVCLHELKNLGFVHFQIVPLTKTEQIDLLAESWKLCHKNLDSSPMFDEYAILCEQKMRQVIKTDPAKILGIPLFCRIFAEVLERDAYIYARHFSSKNHNLEYVNVTRVFELYNRILGFRKEEYELSTYHTFKALECLCPKFAEIYMNCKNLKPFVEKPEAIKSLVIDFEENTKSFIFLHRSFAEFLVAQLNFEFLTSQLTSQIPIDRMVEGFTKKVLARTRDSTKVLQITISSKEPYYELLSFKFPVTIYFLNEFLRTSGNIRNTLRNTGQIVLQILNNLKGNEIFELIQCSISGDHFYVCLLLFEMLKFQNSKQFIPVLLEKPIFLQPRHYENPVTLLLLIAAKHSNVNMLSACFSFYNEYFHRNLKNFCSNILARNITPMHYAIRKADYGMVQYLLDKMDLSNRNLLHECIGNSYVESEDLNCIRWDISRLLILAKFEIVNEASVLTGRVSLKLLELLIQKGANLDMVDDKKQTIVHRAAIYMKPAHFNEFCHLILQQKSQLFCGSDKWVSPINFILTLVQSIKEQTVEILLNNNIINIHEQTDDGNNFILSAVKGRKNVNVIKLLIDYGVLFSHKNKKKSSALHFAAEYNNTDVASLFISLGLDIKDTDHLQRTPLHLAAQNACESVKMTSLLLSHGATITDLDIRKDTVVHKAAANMKSSLFLEFLTLLKEKDHSLKELLMQKNKNGLTPLAVRRSSGLQTDKEIHFLRKTVGEKEASELEYESGLRRPRTHLLAFSSSCYGRSIANTADSNIQSNESERD